MGVLGNLYSRLRHGVAAAALLPAIFVQVPSGLAASGSLLAGLSTADQITNTTTYSNGTAKLSGNLTSTVSIHDGLGHPFLKFHATGQRLYLTLPMAVCSSASGYFFLSVIVRDIPLFSCYLLSFTRPFGGSESGLWIIADITTHRCL